MKLLARLLGTALIAVHALHTARHVPLFAANEPKSAEPSSKKGRVEGVITVRQEDRFRLEDDAGVGYLFTLKHGFRTGATDLARWSADGVRVTVHYKGQADMGAVAESVRPTSEEK